MRLYLSLRVVIMTIKWVKNVLFGIKKNLWASLRIRGPHTYCYCWNQNYPHICMCICMCMYMYVHVYMYICMYMYLCMCVYVCMDMGIIYIYMNLYICINFECMHSVLQEILFHAYGSIMTKILEEV